MNKLFKENHPVYASVKYDFYFNVFHEAFYLKVGNTKRDVQRKTYIFARKN